MIGKALSLAMVGGEPILYVLVGLSLLSLAVAAERGFVYWRSRVDLPEFIAKLVGFLNGGDLAGAQRYAASVRAAESSVAVAGLSNFGKSAVVVGEMMEAVSIRQKQRLDQRLSILGTVGSNAPFIGLLGTVLGIIKAFHDLSANVAGGPSVVMAGIAEALVATAIGLLVAIPAVVLFNYFKNRQLQTMSNIEQLQRMLLAFRADGAPQARDAA